MKETQIKTAIKAGNSSAVILPRSWLNKDVRVELIKKTPEMILFDSLNITKKHIDLSDVIGVYLTGSYARGEENGGSDIDVLVITKETDKEMINEGIYNILIISSELLKQKLEKDLFPIGQMIREAKPLLNSNYLDSVEVKITKSNIRWYLDTTEDKLKIIDKVIDKVKNRNEKYADDRIAYTLILRIRTLHIIKKLIKNENYSKKEFVKIIKNISKGNKAYEGYLAVKNNLEIEHGVSIEETERLYKYLKNELYEIKNLLRA
jgi:predicted nucleotidyltransferase